MALDSNRDFRCARVSRSVLYRARRFKISALVIANVHDHDKVLAYARLTPCARKTLVKVNFEASCPD